jgi:hypothetical protein
LPLGILLQPSLMGLLRARRRTDPGGAWDPGGAMVRGLTGPSIRRGETTTRSYLSLLERAPPTRRTDTNPAVECNASSGHQIAPPLSYASSLLILRLILVPLQGAAGCLHCNAQAAPYQCDGYKAYQCILPQF